MPNRSVIANDTPIQNPLLYSSFFIYLYKGLVIIFRRVVWNHLCSIGFSPRCFRHLYPRCSMKQTSVNEQQFTSSSTLKTEGIGERSMHSFSKSSIFYFLVRDCKKYVIFLMVAIISACNTTFCSSATSGSNLSNN